MVTKGRGRPPLGKQPGPPEDLIAFGQHFRALREKRELTQADVAGERYTHAYISTIESGKREPSNEALHYFAQRLGVEPEELWTGHPTTWALDIARELRSSGSSGEARRLLERSLTILEAAGYVQPRVVASVHRELGILVRHNDLSAAEQHLRNAIDLYERDPLAPVMDLVKTFFALAEILEEKQDLHGALGAFRAAAQTSLKLSYMTTSGTT